MRPPGLTLPLTLLFACTASSPGDEESSTSTGDPSPTSSAGDSESNTGEEEPAHDLPLLVITVDADGEPVPAARVLVQPAPADPFWLAATPATCADEGASPPCSHWSVTPPTSGQISVSAERTTEAAGECIPYASTFALVHPPTAETAEQVLRLTLPADGTYCIDPVTGRAVVNVAHAEDVTGDTLALPAPPSGPLTVRVIDQNGAPVPASSAHWYYFPESPEFDGEHPLRCADLRCETWVLADGDAGPHGGTVYFNATYAGPLSPFLQQGWSGYDGGPQELAEANGALVPVEITLTVATDEEGAIGG